jgi:hypothetical protein
MRPATPARTERRLGMLVVISIATTDFTLELPNVTCSFAERLNGPTIHLAIVKLD